MKHSRKVRQVWKAVCASAVVGYGIAGVAVMPAMAQSANSATWVGPGNDYNAAGNWDENAVPQDEARFADQGPAAVTISEDSSIGRVLFTGEAQAYSITNNGTYNVVGEGIENNSDFTQAFTNNDTLNLVNNARIKAGQGIVFTNQAQSVVGDGTVITGTAATITFANTSRADEVVFNNLGGAANDNGSDGGTAIGGSASLSFANGSQADNSQFNNIGGNAAGSGSSEATLGGDTFISLANNTHADRSVFFNVGGDSVTTGAEPGVAVGGNANLTLSNNAHADRSTFANIGGNADGLASQGGSAAITLNDNAHADNSQFTNKGGNSTNGGIGGVAAITFNGRSHADNAEFVNAGGLGADGTLGANANITFNAGTSAKQSAFYNIGGSGLGDGELVGTGGNAVIAFNDASAGKSFFSNIGGSGQVIGEEALGVGGNAILEFNGAADAGDSQIFNSGPGSFDGPALVGSGGTGETVFNDTSSAGTSVITNDSGGAVYFRDAATADNATVINNAGGLVDTRGSEAVSIGSLSGAGSVAIGGSTVTLGNLNRNEEISGSIQDGGEAAGSIVKTGTGTLILSGTNTYAGQTIVNNGNLQLDGSLASDVTVNNGAVFSGTGISVGTLTNSGTVAPGNADNPFGSLSVDAFVNNSDGRYLARVGDNGANNQLNANSSNLDGQVVVQGNGLFLNQDVYNYVIITNNTAPVGAFDEDVDSRSALPYYLDATVTNVGNNVELTLTRNSDMPNFTSNQRGVFNALLNSGDDEGGNPQLDPYFAFLAGANNAGQYQSALNILSGDALTAYQLAAQSVSERFNERMRTQGALQGTYTDTNEQFALRPSPRIAYDGTQYREVFAGTDAQDENTLTSGRTGIWATVARAREDADSDGNGAGFDVRATEFQVGINRIMSSRTNVGVSVGRSEGRVGIDDRNANGDLDTTSIGAYLRHEGDQFYASGLLSYSSHDIDSTRNTVGGQAKADFDARTIALSGEVGKRIRRGKYSIEPNISLKLSNTRQDSFDENGPGGVSVDSSKYNTRRLGLGVRLINRDASSRVRPHLFLGYEREFGDRQAELTNQLTGLSAFNVASTNLGRNIFSIRAGVDARISDRFSVIGALGASYRSNQDSQFIYGGVKYGF